MMGDDNSIAPPSREGKFEALRAVASDASSIIKSLEAIRNEHERLMAMAGGRDPEDNNTDAGPSAVQQEKLNVLRKSLEKIVLHLDETQVVVLLAAHLQHVEEKAGKLEAQVDRLCDENDWLRRELSLTQQRLNDGEVKIVQLEEEKAQLAFMDSTRIYDTEASATSSAKPGKASPPWNGQKSAANASESEQESSNGSKSGKQPASIQASNQSAPSGDDIPQRLRTLHVLISQYSQQGRFDVAVPLCKQALEDTERTNGFYHMEVATLMNMLALLYRDQGKLEEACDLLHNAARIKEHCLGENQPSVASALNNLSVLYGKRGMWSEAEPICKQALAIREQIYGSAHPDVAKLLGNLGLISLNCGRYLESEGYYQRAIDAYMQLYGPSDPLTTKIMNNLAACYLKQKKHEEAKELYRQVLLASSQVQTTFGADQSVTSPTAAMNTANYPPTSPGMDGSDLTLTSSQQNRGDGEETLAKTFDVTRLVSSSPIEDILMSNVSSARFPISPADAGHSAVARGRTDDRSSTTSEPSSQDEPTSKRVSSFSRLKGSVGRALGKVMTSERSNSRSRDRRSSSLPREGSESDASPNPVVPDSPSKSPAAPSPSPIVGSHSNPANNPLSPRQAMVLASPSSISRPNSVQSESSTPLPRRGPLRAYHKDEAV